MVRALDNDEGLVGLRDHGADGGSGGERACCPVAGGNVVAVEATAVSPDREAVGEPGLLATLCAASERSEAFAVLVQLKELERMAD